MHAPPAEAVGGGTRAGLTFIPDYMVRAVTDVVYLRVNRSLYQAAKSATLLERAQRDANNRTLDYESDLEQVFCGSSNREEMDLVLSLNNCNIVLIKNKFYF